jgi:hypothetical protein
MLLGKGVSDTSRRPDVFDPVSSVALLPVAKYFLKRTFHP